MLANKTDTSTQNSFMSMARSPQSYSSRRRRAALEGPWPRIED